MGCQGSAPFCALQFDNQTDISVPPPMGPKLDRVGECDPNDSAYDCILYQCEERKCKSDPVFVGPGYFKDECSLVGTIGLDPTVPECGHTVCNKANGSCDLVRGAGVDECDQTLVPDPKCGHFECRNKGGVAVCDKIVADTPYSAGPPPILANTEDNCEACPSHFECINEPPLPVPEGFCRIVPGGGPNMGMCIQHLAECPKEPPPPPSSTTTESSTTTSLVETTTSTTTESTTTTTLASTTTEPTTTVSMTSTSTSSTTTSTAPPTTTVPPPPTSSTEPPITTTTVAPTTTTEPPTSFSPPSSGTPTLTPTPSPTTTVTGTPTSTPSYAALLAK